MNFVSKVFAFGMCALLISSMPSKAASDQILKPFKLVAAAVLGAGTGYVFAEVVADQEDQNRELSFANAAIIATALSALFYLRTDVINNQLGKEFWGASSLSALMVFLMRYSAHQKKHSKKTKKCVYDEECYA